MAAPVVESVITGGYSASSYIQISKPTGTSSGDFLVAIIGASTTLTSGPSGWTEVTEDATPLPSVAVWTKVAGSSEPSSYRWNMVSGNNAAGAIWRISGSANAIDQYNTTDLPADASAPYQASAGGITPSDTESLLIAWYGLECADVDPTTTMPAGITASFDDIFIAAGRYSCRGGTKELSSAAATGSFVASSDQAIDDGSAVILNVLSSNNLPTAPTLTFPVGSTIHDAAEDLSLQFSHNDADGDSQVDAEVRYRLLAGSWTTQTSLGSDVEYTISGAAEPAGDYEWQARTSDSVGFGSWSSSSYFTFADKPADPVITAPTDASTVTAVSGSVTMTHASTPDYLQVRVTSTDGATTHFSSGTVAWATTYGPANLYPEAANDGDVLVEARVKKDGLWSDWDSHTITVDLTPPPMPGLTLSEATGKTIRSVIVNPAPSGGEPDLLDNTIHRRQSQDGGTTWTDEAGTGSYDVVATGVIEDGTWDDYAVGDSSVWDYQYRVVANGDDGTTTTGTWATSTTGTAGDLVAYVDTTTATDSNPTSVVVSGITGNAAHLYVVGVSYYTDGTAVSSISDTMGITTWTKIGEASRSQSRSSMWVGSGATGDGTVTVNFDAGAGQTRVSVTRLSGCDLDDAVNDTDTTTGLSSTFSGSLAATDQGMVLLVIGSKQYSHSPGGGFTEQADFGSGGPSGQKQAISTSPNVATGAKAYDGSFSNTGDHSVVAASFR